MLVITGECQPCNSRRWDPSGQRPQNPGVLLPPVDGLQGHTGELGEVLRGSEVAVHWGPIFENYTAGIRRL